MMQMDGRRGARIIGVAVVADGVARALLAPVAVVMGELDVPGGLVVLAAGAVEIGVVIGLVRREWWARGATAAMVPASLAGPLASLGRGNLWASPALIVRGLVVVGLVSRGRAWGGE